MPTGRHELRAADDRFLASFAAAIARRRLAAPAVVLLECLRPVSFLGSQVMQVLSPFIGLAGASGDWDRLAGLLEQRANVDRLLAHLETAAAPQRQPGGGVAAGDGAFIVTDCGSTTTKAVLFARRDGCYRLAGRAESPTTVESPVEDVLCGVRNALSLLQDQTGHRFLADDGESLLPAAGPERGVRACLATSSAGGGLQMVVVGLVRSMTAASAEKAALGAGAIVTAVVAHNDDESTVARLEQLRRCRPDIVLLSGGTDGGAVAPVVALAELIAAADIRPRHGDGRLPVIFAGNRDAEAGVQAALARCAEVVTAGNLRPTLEEERLPPVRACIHEVFLHHVMARAPGYPGLQGLCQAPVMPTPAAFGAALDLLAQQSAGGVVAVDLGGATTDVFSVQDGVVRRSVSANLGLSYSLGTVCARAGWDRVARWLPGPADPASLRDRVHNKMARPTTLPVTWDDLLFEQAAAREALRLALLDHHEAMQPLRGGRTGPVGVEALRPAATAGPARIDWAQVRLLLGSGGPLANAPRRTQAAAILIDSCRPVGVTELAVDSVFVLPHLGMLRQVDEEAAAAVLARDAIVILGCCLAPVGLLGPAGRLLAAVRLESGPAGDGPPRSGELRAGELQRWPLAAGAEARLLVTPQPGVDFGSGPGQPVEAWVRGGPAGLVLDGRGADLVWPDAELARRECVRGWLRTLDALPAEWP
jgi:uncharacterized protein (TIGR01319 family)